MKKYERIDLSGHVFGQLTVLRVSEKKDRKNHKMWKCVCSCGKEVEVESGGLRSGHRKSCGCWIKQYLHGEIPRTHGMTKTRFYKIYRGIKQRCLCKTCNTYKYYGALGIKICDEWLDFINFKNDMYESYLKHVEKFGEKDTSIDRINVDGNYCKKNCKWSTCKEQSNNTRTNRFLTLKGETLTISQWARKIGCNKECISQRINRYKWTIEKALTTPIRKRIN